jgi:hypothetical protein
MGSVLKAVDSGIQSAAGSVGAAAGALGQTVGSAVGTVAQGVSQAVGSAGIASAQTAFEAASAGVNVGQAVAKGMATSAAMAAPSMFFKGMENAGAFAKETAKQIQTLGSQVGEQLQSIQQKVGSAVEKGIDFAAQTGTKIVKEDMQKTQELMRRFSETLNNFVSQQTELQQKMIRDLRG